MGQGRRGRRSVALRKRQDAVLPGTSNLGHRQWPWMQDRYFLPGVELGPGVGAKEHTRFEIWFTFAFAVGNWELRSMGPLNDIAGIWNCTASKTVVARQIWRQK